MVCLSLVVLGQILNLESVTPVECVCVCVCYNEVSLMKVTTVGPSHVYWWICYVIVLLSMIYAFVMLSNYIVAQYMIHSCHTKIRTAPEANSTE